MKTMITVLVLALLLPIVCRAREAYVSLTNYVRAAEAVCTCTVQTTNVDNSVTIAIEKTLKGTLGKTETIRGETGHCIMAGPVAKFMKPGERFLVFLFKDNVVGRLGGIVPIKGDTLVARFIDGFTGAIYDKKAGAMKLPLVDATKQIEVILKTTKDIVQPKPDGDGKPAP